MSRRVSGDIEAAAELSRSLCPEDQKRLLRLVDGLNLLTEEAAFSNYREGLRNGMRLACAVFCLTAGNSGGGRGLRNPDITGTDKGAVNGIGGKTPSRRSHSASRTDIAGRDRANYLRGDRMDKRKVEIPLVEPDGRPGKEEKPIRPEIYPVIDNDLARDNLENDLTAADLQDL